jgi:hypothetical protein
MNDPFVLGTVVGGVRATGSSIFFGTWPELSGAWPVVPVDAVASRDTRPQIDYQAKDLDVSLLQGPCDSNLSSSLWRQ